MAENKTLKPQGDVITKVIPLAGSSIASQTIATSAHAVTDDQEHMQDGEKSGAPTSTLALRPYHRIIKQADAQKKPVDEAQHQACENQKKITRQYRHMMMFFKSSQYPKMAKSLLPLTPLMEQLYNLRNGRPLTYDALKMLYRYYSLRGMNVHEIDRPALDNPATCQLRPYMQ